MDLAWTDSRSGGGSNEDEVGGPSGTGNRSGGGTDEEQAVGSSNCRMACCRGCRGGGLERELSNPGDVEGRVDAHGARELQSGLITLWTMKGPMNLGAGFRDSTHRGRSWVESHTFWPIW